MVFLFCYDLDTKQALQTRLTGMSGPLKMVNVENFNSYIFVVLNIFKRYRHLWQLYTVHSLIYFSIIMCHSSLHSLFEKFSCEREFSIRYNVCSPSSIYTISTGGDWRRIYHRIILSKCIFFEAQILPFIYNYLQ